MVHESEQHKAESEVQRDRVAAENFLEVRVFHVKSCLQEDSRRDEIPEEDRCKGQDKCQEILAWVDHNEVAGKERTLAQSCCPIFRRFYAASGVPRGNSTGTQACQERPGTDPIIEEVDRLTCHDKSSMSVRTGLMGFLDSSIIPLCNFRGELGYRALATGNFFFLIMFYNRSLCYLIFF